MNNKCLVGTKVLMSCDQQTGISSSGACHQVAVLIHTCHWGRGRETCNTRDPLNQICVTRKCEIFFELDLDRHSKMSILVLQKGIVAEEMTDCFNVNN